MLAIAGSLLSGGAARAGDYAIKIGADTQSGADGSFLICWFDHPCHGELKELGLKLDIDLRRAMPRVVRLRLHGWSLGCCHFENGRDEMAIDLRGVALHQLPIFKGVSAGDGMSVGKERVGSLYLKFRLLSPDHWDDRRGSEEPI
jgi:hypothetical protein